jgi:acetyl esterase
MAVQQVTDNPRARLHPQSRAIVEQNYALQGGPRHPMSVADARAAADRVQTLTGPEIGAVTDVTIPARGGPRPARIYRPAEQEQPVGTLLFLHGGGWVLGTLDGSDATCRSLALESGCTVVSLDYRLAPEHPFPAAVDDTMDALAAVAEGDMLGDPGPLAIGGMSAGGNLAAVASLIARQGGPTLAYQLLIVPVCDADLDRPSYRLNAAGLGLEAKEMEWFWNHYLPDVAQRTDWRASPLRAEVHDGLPPASVILADCDPLVDEGIAYADALQAAGVDVVCSRWYGMHHGFFANPFIDAGKMALAAEARQLRSHLAAA